MSTCFAKERILHRMAARLLNVATAATARYYSAKPGCYRPQQVALAQKLVRSTP